jgi:5-methylcytosine-specific restriction endonuclease McrA
MRKKIEELDQKMIVEQYKNFISSYDIATYHGCSQDSILKVLRLNNALRNRKEAAKARGNTWKQKISESAKKRTGNKNPFFGKKHSETTKEKLSNAAKERTGKRNPNYRHGQYKRRAKDFLITEFSPIRKSAFERDSYTCNFCNKVGGDLHAHHKIPYWVCKEAYLDVENLITCCENCHLTAAHNGDYARFNTSIINDELIVKYKLDRERLNELADFNNKKSDAIV